MPKRAPQIGCYAALPTGQVNKMVCWEQIPLSSSLMEKHVIKCYQEETHGMSFQMVLLLSQSCPSFGQGRPPPGCALCLLQPWRVPHLGPSTRNYVPFIPTPLPSRTSLAAYCYSINLYFINDDSKKVMLTLMLITAMLKHHFPSKAFPECDRNHREEKAQRDSQALSPFPQLPAQDSLTGCCQSDPNSRVGPTLQSLLADPVCNPKARWVPSTVTEPVVRIMSCPLQPPPLV